MTRRRSDETAELDPRDRGRHEAIIWGRIWRTIRSLEVPCSDCGMPHWQARQPDCERDAPPEWRVPLDQPVFGHLTIADLIELCEMIRVEPIDISEAIRHEARELADRERREQARAAREKRARKERDEMAAWGAWHRTEWEAIDTERAAMKPPRAPLSQAEYAKRAGVNRTTLRTWLKVAEDEGVSLNA